jgi:hypothetical protein
MRLLRGRAGRRAPPDAIAITADERDRALADLRPGHRIVAGEGGRPVVAPATLTTDEVLAVVRRRRNALLAACDWTQAADSPISTTDRSAWAEYRQALRTLPKPSPTRPASSGRSPHAKGSGMTELTTTIGAYDAEKRTVPVTFTSGAIRHTREVNAVLDEGGAYDKAATRARVEQVALGVAHKIALGVIAEPVPEPAPDPAGPAAV